MKLLIFFSSTAFKLTFYTNLWRLYNIAAVRTSRIANKKGMNRVKSNNVSTSFVREVFPVAEVSTKQRNKKIDVMIMSLLLSDII